MGRIVVKLCPCGREFEVLRVGGRDTCLEREGDAIDDLSCPACGSLEAVDTFRGVAPAVVHGARFPYFDLGLGETVESEQHRRSIMRAKGLVDFEGEAEREAEVAARAADDARRRVERELAEDADRQAADPDIRAAQARVQAAHRAALEKRERYGTSVDVIRTFKDNPGVR